MFLLHKYNEIGVQVSMLLGDDIPQFPRCLLEFSTDAHHFSINMFDTLSERMKPPGHSVISGTTYGPRSLVT